MKIWAHRGCSQRYPENTLLAFEKAMEIKGLAGIELDIQLTKDGELAVIHDERVDRTTEGMGFVRDYTWEEIRRFHIYAGENMTQKIPSMQEVLDLLMPRLKSDSDAKIKLNIELKNNVYPYPGMEKKIVELVHKKGLAGSVIYSSFYALSLQQIKKLDPKAEIGVLDSKVSDCLYKLKGLEADALHPFWRGMDMPPESLKGYIIRAWLTGHLYPEKPTGTKLDLEVLEEKGITDLFLNEPEIYLQKNRAGYVNG